MLVIGKYIRRLYMSIHVLTVSFLIKSIVISNWSETAALTVCTLLEPDEKGLLQTYTSSNSQEGGGSGYKKNARDIWKFQTFCTFLDLDIKWISFRPFTSGSIVHKSNIPLAIQNILI